MANVRILSAGKPPGIYDASLVRALCWDLLFPLYTDFRLTPSVLAEKRTEAVISAEPGSGDTLGIYSMTQFNMEHFSCQTSGRERVWS